MHGVKIVDKFILYDAPLPVDEVEPESPSGDEDSDVRDFIDEVHLEIYHSEVESDSDGDEEHDADAERFVFYSAFFSRLLMFTLFQK